MSIWRSLKKAKTVPDLEKQRADLAGVITHSEGELARLRTSLTEDAFTAGDAFDPRAIGASIREADDELTALRAVLAAVDAELLAAQERERMATLESRAGDGRKLRKQLHRDYTELHRLLSRVTELVGTVRKGRRDLHAINTELAAAGRPDLEVRHPLGDIADILRPQGGGLWRGVDDAADDSLHVAGYFPRHSDGPDLQHLDRITP